jgi:hypothetical protein
MKRLNKLEQDAQTSRIKRLLLALVVDEKQWRDDKKANDQVASKH